MATDTRRDLLKTLALGLGVVACRGAIGQPAENAVYVGIETSAATGLSRASFFGATGARIGTSPLDFRAHGMTSDDRRVIVFPRRPGDRFAVLDRMTLGVQAIVTAPPGRHFFGHGAITRDGKQLLVTENDLDTMGGAVAVYDLDDRMRRVEVFGLPAAGPHEIVRHPDRDAFYVALGGLETHPAYGRTSLNLHEFRSEVVRLDAASGGVDRLGHWAGSEGVSLRHLAVDGADRLYVGGQIADTKRAGQTASVAWVVENSVIRPLSLGNALAGYVSSVAAAGREAIMSSKKSGRVIRLDGSEVLGTGGLNGAGAVALGPRNRAVAGYTTLVLNGARTAVAEGFEFDNHGLILTR